MRQGLKSLEDSHPIIHLNGVNQVEADQIAREVTIVIEQQIQQLGTVLQLSIEDMQILSEGFAAVENRTYLWVHLVFADLNRADILNKNDLRKAILEMPHTVEQAYNKILQKSHNPEMVRKILHIIVAAERPLDFSEMSVALAFQAGEHREIQDLQRDLLSLDRLQTAIREACSLFVVIRDSKIFLIHQTAREFLVRMPPRYSQTRSPSLEWQYALGLSESHRLLSEICIQYLLLADFKGVTWATSKQLPVNDKGFGLLNYAAAYWANHFRQGQETSGSALAMLALRLCQPDWLHWLDVYGRERHQGQRDFREV
jgi:ankyrin repeat domain-containing protein 50